MTIAPEERHSNHRGRWSEPNLPHKGWTCVDMQDLGPEENGAWIICEMCQCSEIRYAHHMTHPDRDEEIVAGRTCAGNMEENYIDAERRENNLKRAGRQDWFRFMPGFADETWTWALPIDTVQVANAIAWQKSKAAEFRGLVICRPPGRMYWAERAFANDRPFHRPISR